MIRGIIAGRHRTDLKRGARMVRRCQDRMTLHDPRQAYAECVRREVGFAALRVNGRMRDECLNETLFTSLAHAREKIAIWAEDYNTGRPHSSLGYATPAAFAAELKKQGAASLRMAGGYATQPLASPARMGNNDAEILIATG
jgi:hypothetical protein